jgi:signal transduction histidine kinase
MERRFLHILLAGFGLVLIAMIASGMLGLQAMSRIDREAGALSERYLRETSLIDQLARQQAAIGVLLYSMADQRSPASLARLDSEFGSLRQQVARLGQEALAAGPHEAEAAAWRDVARAAEPLFSEIRSLLARRRNNSIELSSYYRDFTTAAARLLDASYDDAARSRTAQLQLDAGLLLRARNLFLIALALAGLCATVSVLGAFAMFHRLEKYAAKLARLSLHTLAEQEESARRFSQDMHDEFGQALNAIESTLTVVQTKDADSHDRLQDAIVQVKEAQATAREMSHLLRPRILDDFGLDAGLRELARGFSQRTGIVVDYRSSLRERIAPLVETHLFRIAQEALTNTSRHTMASTVDLALDRVPNGVRLTVSDNGGGLPPNQPPGTGLGLLGMQERAQAVGGVLTLRSKQGEGLTIQAVIPVPTIMAASLTRLEPAAGETQ